MSQLPDEAFTYQSVVAEYFLALRGAGLMLSPLDREQVQAWERRGIPVAVVCRGLRRGVEQARERAAPSPRSIRGYRLVVEEEWRAYRGGRVGDAPAPPDEATASRRRLEAAQALIGGNLRALDARDPRCVAYAAAAAALRWGAEVSRLEQVDALLGAADAALLRAWLLALPRHERATIGARCHRGAGSRQPWTRRVEHRAVLRVHVLEAAREAGLLCLRGSV